MRAVPCRPRAGANNMVGPDLNGVLGRKAGTEAGFNYSDP